MNDVKFEKILDLHNDAEARLLHAHLEERGIPHLVRSYHDPAYDGIFQVQFGWGHIEAPPEYRDAILEIHADLIGPPEA
ncbi:MAG: hypothetical protein ACLFUM_06100 [Spirochaetaceae bacterium]